MTSNSDLPIKNHFFLCHYKADEKRVEEFKKKLEESWIWCWIDTVEIKEKLEVGTELYNQIKKGIEESYCFIVFITDNFIESDITYKNLEMVIAQESSEYPKEILLIGDGKHKKEAEEMFGSKNNKTIVFKDINLSSINYSLIEIAWGHDCRALKHAEHFLIIENDKANTFAKNFRKSLREHLKIKGKRIGLVYDYFVAEQQNLSLGEPPEPDRVLDEMKKALNDFLVSRANYAYIIMPKEPSDWCKEFVQEMRDVNKRKHYENKMLFCIECGIEFEKLYDGIYKDYKEKIPVRLVRIITNYNLTTQKLLEKLQIKIEQPSHIVIIPGPCDSEPANARLKEFLFSIQKKYAVRKRKKDNMSSNKNRNPLVSLSILNIGTWKMKVAEYYARHNLNQVETYNKDVHTAFICSNDATAIGVIYSLSKEWDDRKKNNIDPCLPENISLYGFDRTKEFVDILEGKVDGLFKKNKNKILKDFLKVMKDSERKLEGATIRTDFGHILTGTIDELVKMNEDKILEDFLKAMKDSKRKLEGATIRTDFAEYAKIVNKYYDPDIWESEKNNIIPMIPLKTDDFKSNINE